jgi:putative membrane protein
MRHSASISAAAMFVTLAGAASAGNSESVQLAPVDYAFIPQTNLGNQFQIDTGKLGETHARSATVRDYATLMDSSHVQVQNNLVALLQKMNLELPQASLLSGAYKDLVRILAGEQGATFERDYVRSQLDYQHANDALYRWEIQNGSNPALKAYARETLPKIDDHMHRVEAIIAAETGSPGSRRPACRMPSLLAL